LIAAIVVPAGMPVPLTDWPTNRPVVLDSPVTTGELNVTLLDPMAVAFWFSVICEDELIEAIVEPAGMPVPVTGSPANRPVVLDSPVTTGELNVRVFAPVVVAAVASVIVPAVEPIEATVSPAGIPVPVTDSPASRPAAALNVRFVPPLFAVAFWLRVMAEDELITEIVVPAGIPVPESGSPTKRLLVLGSPVTEGDPLVVLPLSTVVSPVTDVDPLVSVPVKLAVCTVPVKVGLFRVPVKVLAWSVPVKLRECSVPVRAVPAPGAAVAGSLSLMKTAAYSGTSLEPIAIWKETLRVCAAAL
jgi:hypothetical protein